MSAITDEKTPELSRLLTLDRDKIWDEHFGTNSIVVDSAQRAIQISLELLNSGVKGFPVIMPVTAPPAVISGVLRSGAVPLLLDISPVTLNLDAELYRAAHEEFGDGMVTLFCEVPGQPIPQELLDSLKPHSVTILYSPTFPRAETNAYPHTFMVKDLHKLVDKGAVIFHDYEEQLALMYAARDGVLGHDARLSPNQETQLEKSLAEQRMVFNSHKQAFDSILQAFAGTDIGILWDSSIHNEEFGVIVPNAKRAVTVLRSAYYKAQSLVKPLHMEPAVAARYQEKAVYPAAEALMDHLITIPVQEYSRESLRDLVNLVQQEYDHGENSGEEPDR